MNVRPATEAELAQNAKFWRDLEKNATAVRNFEDSEEVAELRAQLDAGLISVLEFAMKIASLASDKGVME